MALVESSWLSHRLRGQPLIAPFDTVDWSADEDWDFHSAADDTPEELAALHDASIAASDAILREALADGGLDQLSALPEPPQRRALRPPLDPHPPHRGVRAPQRPRGPHP